MISKTGKNLVFVLCLPRSGSTLLSALLGAHTRVYAPPEPWFLLPLSRIASAASAEFSPFGEHAAIATSEFLGAANRREAIRCFAQAAYNGALKERNKPIFLDKTPRYYHILDELKVLFPGAKRVLLLRDPFDMAASFKETWGIGADQLCGARFTQYSYDFLLGWPRLLDEVRRADPQTLVLRYEDLVRRPAKELKRICEFLELPCEPAIANFATAGPVLAEYSKASSGDRNILAAKRIHSDSVGAWRHNLGQEELTQLATVLDRESLDAAGYTETVEALATCGITLKPDDETRIHRERLLQKSKRQSEQSPPDIHRQAEDLAKLTALLTESQIAVSAQDSQIEALTTLARERETESTARAHQIEQLTALLRQSQSDASQRQDQVVELTRLVGEREAYIDATQAQIEALTTLARDRETESTARAQQIEQLTALLRQSQSDASQRQDQVVELGRLLTASQIESAQRFAQIKQLTETHASLSSDNVEQRKQVSALTGWIEEERRTVNEISKAHHSAERTVEALESQLRVTAEMHQRTEQHLMQALRNSESISADQNQALRNLEECRLVRWARRIGLIRSFQSTASSTVTHTFNNNPKSSSSIDETQQ